MVLYKALKALLEEYSPRLAFDLVCMISRFHRVQASPGMLDAARCLRGFLEEHGVSCELHVLECREEMLDNVMRISAPWRLLHAELWIAKPEKTLVGRTPGSPLVAAAHSPPSSGWFSLPVALPGGSVEGKAVLYFGEQRCREAYIEAVEAGAACVLWSRPDAYEAAFPYGGLFLTRSEARKYKAPCFCLPPRLARRIKEWIEKGREVWIEGILEAEHQDGDPSFPVVTAQLGQGEPVVLLTAHLCHPASSANDNASGSAGLAELARSMNALLERKALGGFKGSIAFMWAPEYTGFALALKQGVIDPGKVVACANLDMIGEDQGRTGSTLILYESPLRNASPLDALIYYALNEALRSNGILRKRFQVASYSCGSDHDVLGLFGVPACMINQWPDRFYHTSADTPDKVDAEMIRRVCCAVGAAAYTLLASPAEALRVAQSYFHSRFYHALAEAEARCAEPGWSDVGELRRKLMPRAYSRALQRASKLLGVKVDELLPEAGEAEFHGELLVRKWRAPLILGDIIHAYRSTLGEENVKLLKKISRDEKLSPLLMELCMMLDGTIRLDEALAMLKAEHGPFDAEALVKAVEALKIIGLLEARR